MHGLITYQLSDSTINDDLRSNMLALGYHAQWSSNGKTYKLPDNSVWKKDIESLQRGIDDLTSVVNSINASKGKTVRLIRCIAVPVSPWAGIEGE